MIDIKMYLKDTDQGTSAKISDSPGFIAWPSLFTTPVISGHSLRMYLGEANRQTSLPMLYQSLQQADTL